MKPSIIWILVIGVLITEKRVLGADKDTVNTGATTSSDNTSKYEDSAAAASEVRESSIDHDDSDMYMEPDGAESAPPSSRSKESSNLPLKQSAPEPLVPARKMAIIAVDSMRPTYPTHSQPVADSQNFFPTFAEIFNNPTRLSFAEQPQHRQQRRGPFLSYVQRDRPYQVISSGSAKELTATLLGSGNFGVIRGGTYYPEDRNDENYSIDESAFSPFYHRGRHNYYKNPKPQPVRGGDFFANFRDFAELTAIPKSSFSHLSVVYANKNGDDLVKTVDLEQPRNIIETLRLLEKQESENDVSGSSSSTNVQSPAKKLSQGKRKLMKMKKYQEDKARKSRMTAEPLLALS